MIVVAVVTSCSHARTDSPTPQIQSALPMPSLAPEVRNERGTLISSEIVPAPSPPLAAAGASQYLIVYRSASGIDGSAQRVSGTVVVPPGEPPKDGWPVIAYGNPGVGIATDCGPSRSPGLLGFDLVVASLVRLGFVVALSDYQGLGEPGTHPLLEPRTAAFNMIDSVRAARDVVHSTSDRWFAIGMSQGGQASWAANELAADYGDGLQLLGSASLSPLVDLSNVVTLAESGWLTKAQQLLLPTLVFGMKTTHPNLNPDDYLHGALSTKTEMWLACAGPLTDLRSKAVGDLTASDSRPSSAAAAAALREALSQFALPQRPATAPMLVITGADDDTVRSQWVSSAAKRACALGDVVEFIVRPGEGGSNLDGGPRVAQWLSERLTGQQPVDSCQR